MRAAFLCVILCGFVPLLVVSQGGFSVVTKLGTTNFYRFSNESASSHPTFFYKSHMTVDGDGAPNCYGPGDVGTIDYLENAGHPGDWWAVVTDTGESTGNPVRQVAGDPFPGLYIAMTSLANESLPDKNPRKWIDATKIPYWVMPDKASFRQATGAKLGDVGLVVYRNYSSFAIFADTSGDDVGGHVGEGSVALSFALGNNPYGPHGKIDYSIDEFAVYYFALTHTSLDRPLSVSEINSIGQAALTKWGGWDKVNYVIKNLPH